MAEDVENREEIEITREWREAGARALAMYWPDHPDWMREDAAGDVIEAILPLLLAAEAGRRGSKSET